MKDAHLEFWKECVSIAAEECGLKLTDEQVSYVADSVKVGHECYGMAFYQPPDSDRYSQIEAEWRAKYERLQREFDEYVSNAESAVRTALKQYSDSVVSIGEGGSVYRHGGRTEQIQ